MDLDSVQIGAEDMETAVAAYTLLLGVEPVRLPRGAWRFPLAPGAVEIEAGAPGVRAVTFIGTETLDPDAFHGAPVRVVTTSAAVPVPASAPAIDHVVVRTASPERAIALWRDRLGLRLALDRNFPERGLRLMFFRSAGITLEFAAPHPPADGDSRTDRLYGVSYRVTDLDARRERLLAAGVDVSEVRTGMRTGTRVATVRSGTVEVPTLLLEADPRP
jgi:catechol 2,3-dioxygenase-like lactoylglutathione lyase family enzyme